MTFFSWLPWEGSGCPLGTRSLVPHTGWCSSWRQAVLPNTDQLGGLPWGTSLGKKPSVGQWLREDPQHTSSKSTWWGLRLLQFRGWHLLFWHLRFYLLCFFFFLKPKIYITSGKDDFVMQIFSVIFCLVYQHGFYEGAPWAAENCSLQSLLLPPSTTLVKADSLTRRQLPPVTKVLVIPTRLLGWLTSVQQETSA